MKLKATAPSNIALIKYMGKSEGNRPLNPSLSFTLDRFLSTVEVETSSLGFDTWQPLSEMVMGDSQQEKFLKFFRFLKKTFQIEDHFIVRSSNNFPASCGLASSASSFAALTKAACTIAKELHGNQISNVEASELSRIGSGSSCRSFFSPWSLWDENGARVLAVPGEYLHNVIVVDRGAKAISSSEAHKKVQTSP